MKDWKSLSHVRWDCKVHVVFVTKYRHEKIYGELRTKIGRIIRNLCEQKGIELHEGHAIPNRYKISLSRTIAITWWKGKSFVFCQTI
jgi:putative transposase